VRDWKDTLATTVPEYLTGGCRRGWDIAREASASLLTYELYPLGLVGRSLPTVPSLWKTANDPRIPCLFIHGVFHNRSTFAFIKQKLALKGWRHFREIDLLTSIHPVPRLAEQVATVVSQLQREHEVPQIDIIAHSLGGIVARYYVQQLGGDGPVRNLVTLGSPHGGTVWSRYSVLSHLKDLSPQSPFMRHLNSLNAPRSTRAIAVSGELDLLVLPRENGFWPGVRNIHLKRVGHAGLLFSRRVLQIILSNLRETETSTTEY
jgi:triacylglycerol lipase